MNQNYEAKHHAAEENHCWYRARRDILINLVKNYPKDSRILDIGCSGGPLISSLNEIGNNNVYGIDISEEALKLCRTRGLRNISFSRAEKTDFKDSEFDIIIASDVLEHIEDERIALTEWRRILKKDGDLIVFVPAFNFLWTTHDERNQHCRRYSRINLEKLLRESGFYIKKSSYWNFLLFFPTLLIRITQKIIDFILNKKQKDDQLYTLNHWFDNIIFRVLKIENLALEKINFPLGVSVFCIGKKQDS